MKALSIAARATGVLLVLVAVLLLLFAAAASARAVYLYLAEQCLTDPEFNCEYSTDEKLTAVFQAIWGLPAAGFALVCCANLVRRLTAGERTKRLRRRSLVAFGLVFGWLLGPYLMLVVANA